MNARTKAVAPDAAIEAMEAAVDVATIGLSWMTDRLIPMIDALGALAAYSSEQPGKANERLALIRDISKETKILADDADDYFRTELHALKAKLLQLEGGAR